MVTGDTDVEDGVPVASSVQIVDADDATGKVKTVAGQGVWTVNATTGAITFTPAQNYSGPVTPISYTIADSGGLRSTPASVSVTITSVNAAPVADPETATVTEDSCGCNRRRQRRYRRRGRGAAGEQRPDRQCGRLDGHGEDRGRTGCLDGQRHDRRDHLHPRAELFRGGNADLLHDRRQRGAALGPCDGERHHHPRQRCAGRRPGDATVASGSVLRIPVGTLLAATPTSMATSCG